MESIRRKPVRDAQASLDLFLNVFMNHDPPSGILMRNLIQFL